MSIYLFKQKKVFPKFKNIKVCSKCQEFYAKRLKMYDQLENIQLANTDEKKKINMTTK